jgi:hypothetical protein
MQPASAKEATIAIPARIARKPRFAIFMIESNGIRVFKEALSQCRQVQNFPLCLAVKSVS